MKHLIALVMMQLKDKISFEFTKSKQKLISFIVFTLLKFAVVTAVAYMFFWLSDVLAIFNVGGGVPKNVMVVIYAIILFMSICSCTVGLMKTLYFADDNKILITLPVNGNSIFISRLIVYYVFELKRSFFLTVPIFLAFGIYTNVIMLYYLWLPFTFLFVSALPVLVGAILSIPAMFIYRFMQKVPVVKFVIYAALTALGVVLVVKIIALIPENINLNQQLGVIQNYAGKILKWSGSYLYPANYITDLVIGFARGFGFGSIQYTLFDIKVLIYFGILILGLSALGALVFFITKPLFLSMVSKSFEFEKKISIEQKLNKPRRRWASLLKTEVSNYMRSGLVTSFISVYILVPVLIFLINKIFNAIDTRTSGDYMVYAFNLLLILLPILASNALIATLFSRDGRAGYVKKTMPLNVVYPLTIKLVTPIVLSNISIVCSLCIFANMASFSALNSVMICIACVALNTGHIFWSATLDLMNPQNENYATSGEMSDNPNERNSTIIAFIVSAVFAFFSYVLFSDLIKNPITVACFKLAGIGIAFMLAIIYMYLVKIKVYYSEK